jgi:ribokinase
MSVTVASVGSLVVDLAITIPRVPLTGENLVARGFRMGPGGKGANAAAAMARLGARVALVGAVGDDQLGRLELEALAREGVGTDGVRVEAGGETGVAVIMVDDKKENTILVSLGANDALSPDHALGTLEPLWRSLDALLVDFEVPRAVVAAVVDEGARRMVPVVVDAGPPRPWGPETWGRAAVVSPNREEAIAIAGRSLAGDDAVRAAAREMLRAGPRAVVVKMGAAGAVVCTPGGESPVPAFPVVPVDTTGAGDAFTAAMTVAIAEGADLGTAARRGCAAGALAVSRFGTMPAMPTLQELERFLRERS